jgi:NAD(P)-dependent dehydrogenase (short-subunit alcohol dehydrogenase family)
MLHLIVGGSGGIGSAIARRVVRRGGAAHLVGRNADRLAPIAQEIGARFTLADVTVAADLEAAITAAGSPLAGLAYCVGSINLKPLSRLTDADFDQDFALNAKGAALAVKAALPALKASGGASVVLFSTVAVAQGFANHASVSMAKGAIEGLTRALAAELAPAIRVNCIAPSLTRTPLAAGLTTNETMAASIAQMHPLPRLGTAEDSAALADFLLSPESGWITGQIIGVDGGRSSLRTKG